MKLDSYEILDDTINLIFDKQFKQIKYVKFTSKSNKTGELDCDKIEIKFTKAKMSINVYIEDYSFFIFHIKEIDNNKCDYVYYININENRDNSEINENKDKSENEISGNRDNSENIGVGLSKLFNGFEEKTIEKKWECVIKNRNIFANIKRKVKDGNTKIN
jgi:hypothetical protein